MSLLKRAGHIQNRRKRVCELQHWQAHCIDFTSWCTYRLNRAFSVFTERESTLKCGLSTIDGAVFYSLYKCLFYFYNSDNNPESTNFFKERQNMTFPEEYFCRFDLFFLQALSFLGYFFYFILFLTKLCAVVKQNKHGDINQSSKRS